MARYFLACWLAMAGMHDNVNSSPAPDLLGLMLTRPEAFRGLTKEGHSVRWRHDRVLDGRYIAYTLRNFGGRRVEVRAQAVAVFLPTNCFGYGTATGNTFQGYAPGGTRVAD